MKILYYFTEYDSNMYRWQREQIFDNLVKDGIEIELFNPLLFESVDEANERLVMTLRNDNYSLFVTPHNEEWIYINTLQYIDNMGIPTVLICYDNLLIPYEHKNICKYFSVIWLTANENKRLFEKWTCGNNKIVVLPYASNPYLWRLIPEKISWGG